MINNKNAIITNVSKNALDISYIFEVPREQEPEPSATPDPSETWYYTAVQEATNSHDYERAENEKNEKWTKLRDPRDWAELERSF